MSIGAVVAGTTTIPPSPPPSRRAPSSSVRSYEACRPTARHTTTRAWCISRAAVVGTSRSMLAETSNTWSSIRRTEVRSQAAQRPLTQTRKIRPQTRLIVGQMLPICSIARLSGSGDTLDTTALTTLVIGGPLNLPLRLAPQDRAAHREGTGFPLRTKPAVLAGRSTASPRQDRPD